MKHDCRPLAETHTSASAKVIDFAAHKHLTRNPKPLEADPSSAWYHAAAIADEKKGTHHAA